MRFESTVEYGSGVLPALLHTLSWQPETSGGSVLTANIERNHLPVVAYEELSPKRL